MRKTSIAVLMILVVCAMPNWAGDCNSCHPDESYTSLSKPAGIFQKAVGVMDKGQIQNNTGNFGTLSSFHVYFTNALHWPRNADDTRQYCFGLGFMLGIDSSDVLETETQSTSRIIDWLPPDDALNTEFSGEIKAISDDTPFMASSDLRNSWPDIGWPGYFRVDINNLDSTTLANHPDALTLPEATNQFSSDRDIFCTYNDAQNAQGSHGLTVEQTTHSYGRPYAEDIIFWDLKVYNDGAADLEDIYVGFYAKFRPDFDNHDYINFIDTDEDGIKDFVYVYDLDNELDGVWVETNDPLGIVGLRVFDTPGQIGITDFHHFARAASPKTDREWWALMSSDSADTSLTDPAYFFHGDDVRIDYTGVDSLESFYPAWSETEHDDPQLGNAINYVVSCGPFTLKADSMVTISMGIVMGDAGDEPDNPDFSDLMENVQTANEMYRLYFQGSGPPDAPTVNAIPGDEKVSLYWSSNSEKSVDAWTGEPDFEGYKIFRSSDMGVSWGQVVTDVYGNAVGYNPIAQFDYDEYEDMELYGVDVSGDDPAFPQSLGENSGLVHTFVDSNLVNGVEYWYSICAYDRGSQDPDSLVQSYMNAIGASPFETHTVSAVPGPTASNLSYGALAPRGGNCDGTVRLEIENPELLLHHEYRITFNLDVPYVDAVGDTVYGTGLTLVDSTISDTLIHNLIIGIETDTNVVAVDGFLLYLEDATGGVRSLGWTKVAADTCTFDWRVESKYPGLVPSGMAMGDIVETFDDWRITVDYSAGTDALWYDVFYGEINDQAQHLPLKVDVVTDMENPIDVSENLGLGEFNHGLSDDFRTIFYSLLGWDLEPGGLGYLQGIPGWYELHVDMLILEKIDTVRQTTADTTYLDTIPNYLYLLTNNKPDTSMTFNNDSLIIEARAPSDGDEFTIITYKPFRPKISYAFNPLAKTSSAETAFNPLDDLIVVPDPYIVSNVWETNEFGKRLMFSRLPSRCTIRIYTLVGELVDTINHGVDNSGNDVEEDGEQDSSKGYVFWDMRTKNDQFIAPGVYFYHAETPDGHETLGRFLVIK